MSTTRFNRYCNHKSKDGDVCTLYENHYGDHKSKHLAKTWTDED